jgi:geranylgeranyl diphosphate synthase type I
VANDTLAADARGAILLSSPGEEIALVGAVEGLLVEFLGTEAAALQVTDSALGAFARTARDCVLAGGKRLRPTFAYWGWRGVAGPDVPGDRVLPALAALELLHTFALVHDDVMDGSATRRGRPTAHEMLASDHAAAGRAGDPVRFGAAAAVLLGDLCLVWADRLLATADVAPTALLAARRSYDQMRVEAVAGQYLDVLGEADSRGWSVARALRVARLKTASYTVVRPLLLGAALGGGPDDEVEPAYTAYGTAVGEAFQLCDDLLGVYGDPAVTGKPTGDDLRTGKPTALLLLARARATAAQRAELDRRGPRTAADVDRLAAIVADTGAVATVEAMVDERVDAALTVLHAAPIDTAARAALTALAVSATHRRS